jgi:hypothetical protein
MPRTAVILCTPTCRMSIAMKTTVVVGRGDSSLRVLSAAVQRDAIQLRCALLPHSRRSAFRRASVNVHRVSRQFSAKIRDVRRCATARRGRSTRCGTRLPRRCHSAFRACTTPTYSTLHERARPCTAALEAACAHCATRRVRDECWSHRLGRAAARIRARRPCLDELSSRSRVRRARSVRRTVGSTRPRTAARQTRAFARRVAVTSTARRGQHMPQAGRPCPKS